MIPPTEKMFKINTVPKCPQKILQMYQAGGNMGINVAGEFEVKTKDKTFSTSIFPFLQTDHLADQLVGKPKTKLCRSYRDKIVFVWHPIIIWCESVVFRLFKARQNFEEPSNRTFTYDRFSYKVVRVFFDQLHHVTTNEVSLADALDLMVFCNHEGQMDQQSEFETRLYQDLLQQILTKIEDPKQRCFIWMYLRSWGPSGRDWNFIIGLSWLHFKV